MAESNEWIAPSPTVCSVGPSSVNGSSAVAPTSAVSQSSLGDPISVDSTPSSSSFPPVSSSSSSSSPPSTSTYQQPRPRFSTLAEAFGVKTSSTTMSNQRTASPLSSPHSQQSMSQQGYDSVPPPSASPFPPHMHTFAHSSPALSSSPVHNIPQQSPISMSPAPQSSQGQSMYHPSTGGQTPSQAPPTPQRPSIPQGMPMTPQQQGQMPMGAPMTPGGAGGPPMTPMTPSGQPMTPGGPSMTPQMMQMTPQQQQHMMMTGQQPYGYPQQQGGQPQHQWNPQQQMHPISSHYVRQPQLMGAGVAPQRVMIQRVPYPNAPVYPQGQQMAGGQSTAGYVRQMHYPQQGGGPHPGYGYPPGTAHPGPGYPVGVQQQGGGGGPGGTGPYAAIPPQYQHRPNVPPPGSVVPMRPYIQSPQGGQPMMVPSQQQQPVYPTGAHVPQPQQVIPPQQQQQQQQALLHQQQAVAVQQQQVHPQHQQQIVVPQQQQGPHTPQTPYTPNGPPRFVGPPSSSPLHPHQLQQQQQGVPTVVGQNGPPDMRSPSTLMSPSQAAQMMQQQQHQQAQQVQQAQMHPVARPMTNGELMAVQQQQQAQQQAHMRAASMNYVTREVNVPPDMCLLGCYFVVLDWDRYSTEKSDQVALRNTIRSLGGEIDFNYKVLEGHQRHMVTHVIASHLQVPGIYPNLFNVLQLTNKRIVTMQWLVDVVEKQSLEPPSRLAHLPIPLQPDQLLNGNIGRICAVAGFTDSERSAVKYMIESIGAKMSPGLSIHTHILIAKNGNSEKVERAREWQVSVVNLQWLVDAYLGTPQLDLDHPRYQLSGQSPPIEVNCGAYVLECVHEPYKLCLAGWRYPIPCNDELWKQANIAKNIMYEEGVYPLKKLRASMLASPPPTEEEIRDAHAKCPPPPESRLIVVSFEGFDDELTDAMSKKVRMLGGGVCSDVADCTHIVCVDGKRTVRLLEAITMGKNLVTSSWVMNSYLSKSFADTIDFFLRDDEQEKMHGCSFRLSVLRARVCKVFEGIDFFVTPSVAPSVEVVTKLIQLGGGVVHSEPPSPSTMVHCIEIDKPYIIVSTECDAAFLRYLTDAGVAIFNSEIVFTSLLRQEVEPHPSFYISPTSCKPNPLRVSLSGPTSSRRTSSIGHTPTSQSNHQSIMTGGGGATPTTPIEFVSPATPRIKAN